MVDHKLNLKHFFSGRNVISLDDRYEKNVDWNELRCEAECLEDLYVDHSSGDLKNWQALCLHGLGVDKTSDARSYGYPDGDLSKDAHSNMQWTEAAQLAPKMTDFVRSLPFSDLFRVRLFKMNAGGYVGWHGDEGWHGNEDDVNHYTLMVAIHAPNESAVVFGDGEAFSYQERRSALLNFNRWHCATNPSQDDRYMLKIHGKISDQFLKWVIESSGYFEKNIESIAWGIWSVDLRDQWLNQKCRQITSVSTPIERTFFGQDPDSLLSTLCKNFDYVILVKAGTFIDSPTDIEKEILTHHPSFYGHILNYTGEYPFLHDQFIVVQTKKWLELGRPLLIEQIGATLRLADYKRSVENFHDDYTPHYLSPTGQYCNGQSRFGSCLISSVLNSGATFLNVPESIRRQKMFLYPHHGSQKILRKRWKDQVESNQLHDNHKRFFDTYYQKGKEKTTFWPYNSEPVGDVLGQMDAYKQKEFDSFSGPASGLKLEFTISRLSGASIKRLIYFDVSQQQLDFKKHLWDHWAGERYQDFVESYRLQNNIPMSTRLQNVDYQHFTLRPWYNNELLYKSFSKIKEKTKEVHFLNIDLISDSEKIFLLLEDTQTPLFWVSNILTFIFNHMKYDIERIEQTQKILVDYIENKKSGVVIGDRLSDDFLRHFTESRLDKKSLIKSWRDLIAEQFRQVIP